MKYPRVSMFPPVNTERASMVFAYPHQNPMQYPAHLRHKHNIDYGMNDAVRTVAGASVAVVSIGVIGEMGLGVLGVLK
jgi:hypothetical protein